MGSYGQFCPVAKALELLDERWTLLVIRELLSGSRHFNELRRGVPRMSPALLSKRLQRLIRAGVVERHMDGNRVVYVLTPSGEDLRPIVTHLGNWGVRWVPELGDEDFDPHLLMWDMRRQVRLDEVPPGRTVMMFRFTGLPRSSSVWWMVIRPDDVDLCDFDPGFPVDITLEGALPSLVRVWRGDLSWRDVLRSGELTLAGPARLRRAVPAWLGQGSFAAVERPRDAGEQVIGHSGHRVASPGVRARGRTGKDRDHDRAAARAARH